MVSCVLYLPVLFGVSAAAKMRKSTPEDPLVPIWMRRYRWISEGEFSQKTAGGAEAGDETSTAWLYLL